VIINEQAMWKVDLLIKRSLIFTLQKEGKKSVQKTNRNISVTLIKFLHTDRKPIKMVEQRK